MAFLDKRPDVISWSNEELIIPYRSPLDGRLHRYFPDFVFKVRRSNGAIEQYIVEIKPHKETIQPARKSRITKRYLTEVAKYAVNHAKWEACRAYCDKHGYKFMTVTEYDLGQLGILEMKKRPNK